MCPGLENGIPCSGHGDCDKNGQGNIVNFSIISVSVNAITMIWEDIGQGTCANIVHLITREKNAYNYLTSQSWGTIQ